MIVFQYNPETMRRGLEAQHPEAEPGVSAGDTSRVLPPIETFSLAIELDAADQLEAGDTVTKLAGLHPALAELELLLYPSSISMIKNQILALAGSSSVAPLALADGALRLRPVAGRAGEGRIARRSRSRHSTRCSIRRSRASTSGCAR